MKSDNGEIEVYLCPDATTAKTKQQTSIPPSDPLLADIKSPFSPARSLLNSAPTPSTSARRNLTFQTSPESKQLSPSKDPVFNDFTIDTPSLENNSSIPNIVQPMCSGSQLLDMNISDPLHFPILHDSFQRILQDESSSHQDPETIRLKHALISESDDFAPIANKYPLTMYDQGPPGKISSSFFLWDCIFFNGAFSLIFLLNVYI